MRFFSREFLASGTGVAALVLLSLGAAFLVAVVPAVLAMPGQAGLPALGGCLAPLVMGLWLGVLRAGVMWRRERLLRSGAASSGTVTAVRKNCWARVNRRHPWVVRYRYEVGGAAHENSELLWDLPAGCTMGAPVGIVYDVSNPSRSVLKREASCSRGSHKYETKAGPSIETA